MSRERRQVHRSALSERRFRRYFPASIFSSLGSWMLRFLLGWSAWDLTGSATWVGIVAGLMLVPTFVLSPYFGVLSDRMNPRHGLMVSMLVHAGISLTGGLASLFDSYSLTTLLILAFAMGAVTSGHTPMRLALVPLLVSREALPSAVGMGAMTFNTARIIGPAVGAASMSWLGTGAAYLISVLMFLFSLAVLISLRRVGARDARPREALVDQFRAGMAYARGHAGIRLVFAFTVVNGLIGRTVIELLPAVSGQILSGDSKALATLTACAGVGSIIGGLIVSRQSADLMRIFRLIAAGLLFATLTLLTIQWCDTLPRLGAFIGLLSLTVTMAGIGCQTMTHLMVAEPYRGRVLSLWTVLAMGAPAVSAAAMGALADLVGFPAVLAIAGLLGILAIVWLYAQRAVVTEPA